MLKINNLTVQFEKNIVVDNIDMEVNDNNIVAIVGESGSGKTMTALSIAGLLPEDAKVSGDIYIEETNLLGLKESEKRKYRGKDITMVFQEPMTSLNPLMKIGKQIEEVLKLHTNFDKEKRKKEVSDILNAVELFDVERIKKSYPHELSGGMRQRVMIAISLICKPKLIIADEITTALDVMTRDQIIKLLKKINKDYKVAILFVSHNLNVVEELSDYVYVMKNGKVVESGKTKKVFENPENEYTKSLIEFKNGKREIKNLIKKEEVVLEIENLSAYYKNISKNIFKKPAINNVLEDISFKVYKGEIVGLVGKSGIGKTTLSKVILGLHKEFSGKISCVEKFPQMIFQDPYSSLNPKLKIKDMLLEVLLVRKNHTKTKRMEKVSDIIKKVGLDNSYLERYSNELSGGQRQRVAIALALISETTFIIADEPVSALDLSIQEQILQLLKRLQKEMNLTILFISHDMNVINKICDRVIELDK